MHTNLDVICIELEASVRDAIAKMDVSRVGIVIVVDPMMRLAGTVTDGDIRRAVLANIDLNKPVSHLLEQKKGSKYADPIFALSGSDRSLLRDIITNNNINQLPIVDRDQKVVGLVTLDEFVPNMNSGLQAMIMAGGAGVRLRPLTEETPKPMLPVGGQPLLEIIVEQLRDAGIKNLNLAVHYQSDKIIQHFGDGEDFGVEIRYVTEDKPLGTAGAVSKLRSPEDTVLIIYGDILTQVDFRAMLTYHREQNADLTVAVQQYEMQVPYGVIEYEGSSIKALTEKPSYNFLVNAGIYMLEPSAHRLIPQDKPSDMTDVINRILQEDMNVAAFPIHEVWIDIGQKEQYQEAMNYVVDKGGAI